MAEPKRPLHVLFAGLSWPPETFLKRLMRGLLEDEGFTLTVACDRRPGEDWLARPGFQWLRTPAWEGPNLLRIARLLWAATRSSVRAPRDSSALRRGLAGPRSVRSVSQELNRVLPYAGGSWDVIYFPWNIAAIAHLALCALGKPIVVSCRGAQVQIAPHVPGREWLKRWLPEVFSLSAAVHCVSESIRDEAASLGLNPRKARVIRPAVDPEFFVPRPAGPGEAPVLRVVSTGSLIWRKGFEHSLLALRRLLDAGVPAQLRIIGDGPERQRVLYTIADLQLPGAVVLEGKLPPEAVRARLQESDVYLLSSVSEGISNAALEAMACGLPVVTTACGGMPEAVADGIEGFVVPVRDPGAATCALLRLAADPALRRRMGEAARERVCRDFSLPVQVRAFAQLFRDVAEAAP